MDVPDRAEPVPEPISIARCRELLGDDAEMMSDEEVVAVASYAETLAHILIAVALQGRNGHYAYYHCQRQCRAVSEATLEGAFVDELALLQPTSGYMRLVKDRILHGWEQRRAEANERTTE